MVATSRNASFLAPVALPAIHGIAGAGVSSGTLSGLPIDLHRFRAVFPGRWSDLLRRHFRNAAHVAVFFDCDEKTARNWMAGITGPSGPAAILAASQIPGAVEYLTRAA